MHNKSNFKSSTISSNAGMTMIEIMIVLGIIGALASILIPKVIQQQSKAKVSQTKLAMSNLINGVTEYYSDCGTYPTALGNLVEGDDKCKSWQGPYVKKSVLQDSWKNDFTYSAEGGKFVIISLGADKREGGESFDKDISSEEFE